jgi:outer membrane protein assembly factor BamB
MGSPVVYGPSVLTPDFRNGRLYALNATNGTAATSFPVGTLTRFATPALDTGRAYVGTTSGVVAVALQ